MSTGSTEEDATALSAAGFALIEVAVQPACVPGVVANLAIIARHAAITRAAHVDPRIEAAEVFRP